MITLPNFCSQTYFDTKTLLGDSIRECSYSNDKELNKHLDYSCLKYHTPPVLFDTWGEGELLKETLNSRYSDFNVIINCIGSELDVSLGSIVKIINPDLYIDNYGRWITLAGFENNKVFVQPFNSMTIGNFEIANPLFLFKVVKIDNHLVSIQKLKYK